MEQALTAVIKNHGKKILLDPQKLQGKLVEQGCEISSAVTLSLILHSCPSIGKLLQTAKKDDPELNTLYPSAVESSGLTARVVREVLGQLLSACGIPAPKYQCVCLKASNHLSQLVESENDVVTDLVSLVDEKGEESENAVVELDRLSEAGSGLASYHLGLYHENLYQNGRIESRELSLLYYQRSADQGYSPAWSRLGQWQLRLRHPREAMQAFSHPCALFGPKHPALYEIYHQLCEHERTAGRRYMELVILQACIFVLAVLLGFLAGFTPMIWCSMGLLAVNTGWCVFCSLWDPLRSHRIPCCIIACIWLLLVITVL